MPISPFTEVSHLNPPELCDHLEQTFYADIRQLIQTIQHNLQQLTLDSLTIERVELFSLLFLKLQEEVMQMMRNDEIIIFPLIRNAKNVSPCPARKLPIDMIQHTHQRIMLLLEKIRQQANNYLPKSGWEPAYIICCSKMFTLEQVLHRAIYTKENELLQKVKIIFNKPCSGSCNH